MVREDDLRIGINGFGRIGRLLARQVWMKKRAIIVGINDPMLTAEAMVYLLKYDSIHGRFPMCISSDGNDAIKVDGHRIPVFACEDANQIPWRDVGAEYVAETSGHYLTAKHCFGHLEAGATKVIISAPAMDEEIPTFIIGVNDCCYESSMRVVSNASCTSNCLAPLAKLIHDNWGIEEGFMSTIHAVTASQSCVDCACKKDYRSGRCCGRNIIATTTGATEAVVKVLPELKGRLSGMAFRVPVENVSVLDLTCRLSRPMNSLEELSRIICDIEKDSNHRLHGIITATCDPVVTSDFNGDEHSCVLDGTSCLMLNPTFIKLVAYYDNEWGYAARLLDFIVFMCGKDHESKESGK